MTSSARNREHRQCWRECPSRSRRAEPSDAVPLRGGEGRAAARERSFAARFPVRCMDMTAVSAPRTLTYYVRRDAPFFLVALGVFLFDLATKAVIRGNLELGESWPNDDWLVRIKHVTNDGAAF